MVKQKTNFFEFKKIRKSLYFRLGTLLLSFTSILIMVLYYQFNYSFTTQDSILDAHEAYYYSKMVESWGTPPDTVLILEDIENLHLNCHIFRIENDYSEIDGYGPVYWSHPKNLEPEVFYAWSIPEDFEQHGVSIPLQVDMGTMGDLPSTAVANDDYVFYFSVNYREPSELPNFILASLLTIFSMIGLSYFIQRHLYPVQLMKKRVYELENGDLDSEIPILGDDELAGLSKAVNKMIKDIRYLLNQKQQLLLDVSHEFRTPLARMQLLIEMLPQHKNIGRLKNEILLLEGMISNMLLSDRLSTPYTDLDISSIKLIRVVDKVLEMFPDYENSIEIIGEIPSIDIQVDELKIIIAIRNLIDNAIKYASSNHKIQLSFKIDTHLIISIRDFGPGMDKNDIDKITTPFYRISNKGKDKRPGFGLGLTICKKIIEAHNGTLNIVSKIDNGSTFSLLLPLN